MSKPQLRALDFLEQRVRMEQVATPEGQGLRSVSGTVAPAEPESPAAYRLRQLHLFRQRQILDRIEADTRPRSRALRDSPVPGRRNWMPIGPAGVERGQAAGGPVVSGRAKAIAVAPGGRRVYVATANGGVWYSGNTGKSWTPLMNGLDYFPDPLTAGHNEGIGSLACGAIALVPGSGHADDKVFVGTGEGDGLGDAYFGIGPLVSDNGGIIWRRENAFPSLVGKGFYAMAVDPDDPERIVAGTSNGVYVREPDGAGGFRWNRKALAGNRVSGLVVAKGRAGKRFFAAVWGDKVYASGNGIDWSPLETDFPVDRVGRIAIAAHPHNPDIVYAQVAFGNWITDPDNNNPQMGHLLGIYRLDHSKDGKWRKITGAPGNLFGYNFSKYGQGLYDNTIIVAPDNENRIYVGGSTVEVTSGSDDVWAAALFRLDLRIAANGDAEVTSPLETIGGDVHADVHGFAFAPNDPEQLWVACDGGVFYSSRAATGSGRIFSNRNKGLQTLTMNYLGTHPTEEEVLFCGAQDNGGLRYIGEDIWLHSTPGDGGYFLVNWANPQTAAINYNKNIINRVTNGGNRPTGDNYTFVQRTLKVNETKDNDNERFLFYAPLAQVPAPDVIDTTDPVQRNQANLLAFGTQRPWISTDFGDSWLPIPSRRVENNASFLSDRNFLQADHLFLISALAFQDSKRLLVGLDNGKIFRYTDTSAANDWSTFGPVEELSAAAGGPLPGKAVTDFALRPGHPNEFFACFGGVIGGANGYRHVWHYDGAQWRHRGGDAPGRQLLDVHFNAIVAVDADQLYAGSDVGVWRSEDGGDHWDTFSFGLPETAVMDLQVSKRDLGGGQELVLLRASTYGRGVFEYQVSPAPLPPAPGVSVDVELFLRDHVLDKGRYPTRLHDPPAHPLPDPRNSAANIAEINTPDIKVAVPDANGLYPFRPGYELSPGEFYLALEDKANQVPVPSSGRAISKVYVQVHNRSAFPAQHVFVMLLMRELGAGALPQLPAGYDANLRAGIPVNGDGWQTLGLKLTGGIYAAHPVVVEFDLPSAMLPSHASIGGGKDFLLVALLHHVDDAYATANRVLDPGAVGNVILSEEKKIAFKRIRAVQHAPIPQTVHAAQHLAGFVSIPATATAAGAPYDAFLARAFRQNDELLHQVFLAALSVPAASSGTGGVPTNLDAGTLLFADQIAVDADVTLHQGTPLVWRARRRIVISRKIDGKGKGAPQGSPGDFGGAGGGSASNPGQRCVLPLSNPAIEIAAAAVSTAGADLDPVWASRAALMLHACKGAGAGGADGANPGGLGGGIVVLCAPVIEFAGSGEIDVSGMTGAGNAGCGGGGLVLLVAGEIIGLRENGPSPNVLTTGGRAGAAASPRDGGNGLLIKKTFS